MIARLWVCTEQPLPVVALAAPLHPVFLLALVLCASWYMLTQRAANGRALLQLAAISAATLAALTMLFVILSVALLAAGLNPTFVLRLTPVVWALGGISLAALVTFYVRRKGLEAIRYRFAVPDGHRRRATGCI